MGNKNPLPKFMKGGKEKLNSYLMINLKDPFTDVVPMQ